MKSVSNFYTTSAYSDVNCGYHAADSWFKSNNLLDVLVSASRSGLINPACLNSICEVGCGAGGVLASLAKSEIFSSLNKVHGFDISPIAIEFAKAQHPGINFFCSDINDIDFVYDVLVCADVFEHVEDVYGFLRSIRDKSNFFIFNIPLDICLLNLLKHGGRFPRFQYDQYGHLHFFIWSTALFALNAAGFEVVSYRFARTARLFRTQAKGFMTRQTFAFASVLQCLAPRTSSLLMGDSLVVMATVAHPS